MFDIVNRNTFRISPFVYTVAVQVSFGRVIAIINDLCKPAAVKRNHKVIPVAVSRRELLKSDLYGEGAVICKLCYCIVVLDALIGIVKISSKSCCALGGTAEYNLTVLKLNLISGESGRIII